MKVLRSPLLPLLAAACALFAVGLCSCRTTPASGDLATLPAARLVQVAQNASDKGEYRFALAAYETLRERFAEDVGRSLWASYEIAFLYHKMGDDARAIALFDDLIKLYADKNDPNVPQGPLVLARKVRANLAGKAKS